MNLCLPRQYFKKKVKRGVAGILSLIRIDRIRDNVFLRNKVAATIILFHKVTDEIDEDGLTVSSQRFAEYAENLKTDFNVVSLGDLLRQLGSGVPFAERTVAITFDDGYLDNYQIAAKVLRQFGLPATFFITTAFIGSNIIPWWDEKHAENVEWMTWEQVRELKEEGFEIGSHTCNHLDLGKIKSDKARDEIFRSKEIIQDKLKSEVNLLAYPYGGEKNMSDENRALVREAGYQCCLSAVKGYVYSDSDPFDLCRIGITNWYSDFFDLSYTLKKIPPFIK